MPETQAEKMNRILRDHVGYTGDGQGGNGALPIGDTSTARKPIDKRDLREVFIPLAESADDLGEAADAAALSATNAAASELAAGSSRDQAGSFKNQAQAAAIAAGAPIVTSLTTPVPANGTVEIVQTSSGAQVWQVVTGAWSFVGWLSAPQFPSISGMEAAEEAIDGQSVRVGTAFNGEPETFVYDADSTLTADGALVVTATGAGVGRWISQRTVYADWAEIDGDNRDLAAGRFLETLEGSAFTVAADAATDHDLTTSSGLKLYSFARFIGPSSSTFLGTVSPNDQDGVNVGVGRNALRHLTKDAAEPLQRGIGNTAVGGDAMSAAGLSADYNSAFGYLALADLTTGYCNTAGGIRSLSKMLDGQYNTAWGCDAALALQGGNDNVAVGAKSMLAATVTNGNTAVGTSSLGSLTVGSENVAVGTLAAYNTTTGGQNVAIGYRALDLNTVNSFSTAIGWWALRANTAAANTAVGHSAAKSNTTGEGISAFGENSLGSNTTGSHNTALGKNAAAGITTGADNTVAGSSALALATTASDNTVMGRFAAYSLTTGNNNIVVGSSALYAGTTVSESIAIGENAASSVSTGMGLMAIGYRALLFATAADNSAVGFQSGYSTTTGTGNTFYGNQSGYGNTTGSNNTAVGRSALSATATYSNTTGIGANSAVTASNQVQLGDSATTTYAYGAVQDRSDARDKADVRDTVLGLDFINALRPVDFRFDYREDYDWGEKDGSRKRQRFHHGLIAQELKGATERLGVDFGGFQDHSISGGRDVLSIGYSEMIGPLIKAVQELSARVADLEGANQ